MINTEFKVVFLLLCMTAVAEHAMAFPDAVPRARKDYHAVVLPVSSERLPSGMPKIPYNPTVRVLNFGPSSSTNDWTSALAEGVYGYGVDRMSGKESFTPKSYTGHLKMLKELSKGVLLGGGWKVVDSRFSESNLAFGVWREAAGAESRKTRIFCCERHFCVQGRASCVFYLGSFPKDGSPKIDDLFRRQDAALADWESRIGKAEVESNAKIGEVLGMVAKVVGTPEEREVLPGVWIPAPGPEYLSVSASNELWNVLRPMTRDKYMADTLYFCYPTNQTGTARLFDSEIGLPAVRQLDDNRGKKIKNRNFQKQVENLVQELKHLESNGLRVNIFGVDQDKWIELARFWNGSALAYSVRIEAGKGFTAILSHRHFLVNGEVLYLSLRKDYPVGEYFDAHAIAGKQADLLDRWETAIRACTQRLGQTEREEERPSVGKNGPGEVSCRQPAEGTPKAPASIASASQATPDGGLRRADGPEIMGFVRGALLGAVVLFVLFIGRKVFKTSAADPKRGNGATPLENAGADSASQLPENILSEWSKVRRLRPLAAGGNPKAQYELGLIYFSGEAVVDDFREARRLFMRAAESGNALAGALFEATNSPGGKKLQETKSSEPAAALVDEWRRAADNDDPDGCFCYGVALLRGVGGQKDVSKAMSYLQKAADEGFATAQYLVGLAMLYGRAGLARDERTGSTLIGKAAMAGHDEAMLCFADFRRQGTILPKDSQVAFTYTKAAADAGNAAAQRLVSVSYTNGDGVEKDAGLARKYLELADGLHRPQEDLASLVLKSDGRGGEDATVSADGSVTFEKIPAGGAMEMLRVACEKTRPTRHDAEDGELAFLNPGENGIARIVLRRTQKQAVVDLTKCRMFLPDGWSLEPEIEARGPFDTVAKFAGPHAHEWAAVEYLHLSEDHVKDDLGDWVEIGLRIFGRLNLSPHSTRADGVAAAERVAWGRLGRRDALYMKYHQADDMAAFAGTLKIGGTLHRLFIVIVRRGQDSWKFEYAFPAAGGVSLENLAYRQEEIEAVSRILVPLETNGRTRCPFCGAGVDDPPEGEPIDGLAVTLKDFTLFDGGPKIRQADMTLACCEACKERLLTTGIDSKAIEGISDIKAQLDRGASIAAVKCSGQTVTVKGA